MGMYDRSEGLQKDDRRVGWALAGCGNDTVGFLQSADEGIAKAPGNARAAQAMATPIIQAGRIRTTADWRSSVAVVAKAEPLHPVPPAPYPVIVSETRTASRQALVSYRGNRYSVPPELAAAQVTVSHPVGGESSAISPPRAGS
ncbi:hypothetical protein A5792_23940 [Mycolicibacterium peregrinum]|uniref:Transposase for insertion sequence element IS21-like C-terminal domain-containing protein n=1 Tax=Mycolicibacterium peregrinum TaxID=43304 RepID=A0A1A0QXL2_MYCPR|nr:hypothetical protein A5792_23940 [Mycolicibacterium peregrinum]